MKKRGALLRANKTALDEHPVHVDLGRQRLNSFLHSILFIVPPLPKIAGVGDLVKLF